MGAMIPMANWENEFSENMPEGPPRSRSINTDVSDTKTTFMD
jgi:hypothetical protein